MLRKNKICTSLARCAVQVAVAVSLISCAEVDSRDLHSSGFYADIEVYSAGNSQTNVWVRLSTGSGFDADEIDLSAGDRLVVAAGGFRKSLVADSGVYLASFNADEGGIDYVVALERSRDVGMPDSVVTLPPGFDIVAPDAGELFNAGEWFNVAWTPSSGSGQVTVSYVGDCVSATSRSQIPFGREFVVRDTGAHSVQVNSVVDAFGEQSEFDRGSICSAQIAVERKNIGTLDPNYGKGGSISAAQTRTVGVQIRP